MTLQLLISIYKMLVNLKALTLIALTLTPIVWIIEKLTAWHISNSTYAIFVLGAIMADHFLGTLYHIFWRKDFSFIKNLSGLVVKVMAVVLVGYLFEGLNELIVGVSFFKEYTITVLRLTVFLYPANSAFELSYKMTNKKFPPMGLMERIKQFTELKKE